MGCFRIVREVGRGGIVERGFGSGVLSGGDCDDNEEVGVSVEERAVGSKSRYIQLWVLMSPLYDTHTGRE